MVRKSRPQEPPPKFTCPAQADVEPSPKKAKTVSAAAAAAAASDADFVDLSGNGQRRVSVSKFKGATLVNIREYYEKGGEMLPGKKGINLKPAEWDVLKTHFSTLQEDLAAGKASAAEIDIGGDRRASVSIFNKKPLCNIREYYKNKEGQMAPGAKGIALNVAQFQVLSNPATVAFVAKAVSAAV